MLFTQDYKVGFKYKSCREKSLFWLITDDLGTLCKEILLFNSTYASNETKLCGYNRNFWDICVILYILFYYLL